MAVVNVPARMFHNTCGGFVQAESRQVGSTPADRNWPKDDFVPVPFCTECKAVVPFYNVSVSRVPHA